MKHTVVARGALAILGLLGLRAVLRPSQPAAHPALYWYKGNLHTHTVNSDGDSTPNEVTSWYREHGYQFLVLSDHNFLTETSGLNAVHAAQEKFLLIPGEEVSDEFGEKPVHLNAYNPLGLVEPAHGASLVETIQRNVDAIQAAKGLPSLNHPNFGWALTSKDLLQVRNLGLFEVYNGHPNVHNAGGGGWESLDEMWDEVLTAGGRMYGIAVDDAHHFKRWGRELSNPGRGWVAVRAASLSRQSIGEALASGDFYASTGVELSDVEVTPGELRLTIQPRGDTRYTTLFLGAGGRILSKSFENTAGYQLREGESYVRARVEASNGDRAWTQPASR